MILICGLATTYCRGIVDSTAFYLQQAEEYIASGELDSAYIYLIDAQEMSISDGNSQGIISSLMRLGHLYDQIGYRTKSRSIFREVRDLAAHVSDTVSQADALNNIGTSFIFEKQVDSASFYFSQASDLLNKTDSETRMTSFLINEGAVLIGKGENEKAIELFKEALNLSDSQGDTANVIVSTLNLGVCYLGLDEYDSSMSYLTKAKSLSKKLNFPRLYRYSLLNQGDLEYNFENFQSAADLYWEYYEFVDSLYSAETGAKIEELRLENQIAKGDLALREEQLENVKKSRLYVTITSFLLLVIITGILIYYRRRSVHRARTQALLEAREDENKRISDLLWKEIGSAVKEKKLVLPGVELPEQSIGGAIEAAKFLANQQYNPFLQLGLKRAVEHLATTIEERSTFKVAVEADDIELEKTARLAVYRVIENLVLDISEQQEKGEITIVLKADNGRIHLTVASDQMKNSKSMLFKSAEARVAQLKGKINRSTKGLKQSSEVHLAMKDLN